MPDNQGNEGSTNADTGASTPATGTDAKVEPTIRDARITAEDKMYLDMLSAAEGRHELKLKEEQAAKDAELAKASITDADQDDGVNGDLDERIKALEADNKALRDKRKEDLLSLLDESDRKKYSEKSVEQLEMLVEYLGDNPSRKKGMSRRPTKATNEKTQLASGTVGSYNVNTKKWE